MKSWYEIYCDRMNETYYDHVCKYYTPFISTIADTIVKSDSKWVIEIGCGAGNITKALSRRFEKTGQIFVAVDNDLKMIKLAKQNLANCNNCVVETRDITTHQFHAEVTHSHGVLEHFNDKQVRSIIDSCSGTQIHYVPSNKYLIPSRGDERLLSADEWNRIYPFDDIVSFNGGKDLILVKL